MVRLIIMSLIGQKIVQSKADTKIVDLAALSLRVGVLITHKSQVLSKCF